MGIKQVRTKATWSSAFHPKNLHPNIYISINILISVEKSIIDGEKKKENHTHPGLPKDFKYLTL